MSLRINSDFNGVTDPDAGRYIAAVEAADGQLLEFAVGKAINDFVVGCKADKTWDAIKASCILAGARTLAGALVPLAGTAPTNINFVSGDYNRKTGLVGDGSTKYLNSNRSNTADSTNNHHLSVYESSVSSSNGSRLGALGSLGDATQHTYIDRFNSFRFASRGGLTSPSVASSLTNPFLGFSRAESANFNYRINGSTTSILAASTVTATAGNYFIFNRSGNDFYSNARLAFYSIGESLDLALLDARVTALITAFGVAIP
jgi:hypothetical protein